MNLEFDELYSTVMKIIEVLGTFTFVVSGIRQASANISIGSEASCAASPWPSAAEQFVTSCLVSHRSG